MSFVPTPHPLLPLPTAADVEIILARPGGAEELAEFYSIREKRIRQALEDPFHFGFELSVEIDGEKIEPWKDADDLLARDDVEILALWGGNRSSKSHYAASRISHAAEKFGNSTFVCLAEKEETSIATQQKLFWEYTSPRTKALNGKRDPRHVYSVNYQPKTGFADRKIVLPNKSEIYFLMYGQVPSDYEGWEFGSKDAPVVCVWADESLPLEWLQMFSRRLKFRRGKLVWPFTPVRGITPAILEFRGAAPVTVKSLPADLLPNAQYPGLPKGHMPYIQIPYFPKARAIYFHSRFNIFATTGGKTYWDQVKDLCDGKPDDYIERVAYGVARNTTAVALPTFGTWNVVREESLPETGTNYQLTDPHGARNWASIWVRVTDSNPPDFYVYRDWPNESTYGPWATASSKINVYDGEIGPAQQSLGYGVLDFKRVFRAQERIPAVFRDGRLLAADPYRMRRLRKALKSDGPFSAQAQLEAAETDIHEEIAARYIDPRAGRNPHADEHGGTCLIDQFASEQRDRRTNEVVGERMIFLPWSGVEERFGLTALNTLLEWDQSAPLEPVSNAPRLYVSEKCRQVIWAMSNYTGRDGPSGACKDFIDLLRAMALAPLRHVTPDMLRTRGGGAY